MQNCEGLYFCVSVCLCYIKLQKRIIVKPFSIAVLTKTIEYSRSVIQTFVDQMKLF